LARRAGARDAAVVDGIPGSQPCRR
jgi:hypothetical protein